MTTASVADGIMRAADGTPLKIKLRQAERREVLRAFLLIAPLFLFIVISFLIPIVVMLKNAFYDPDVRRQSAADHCNSCSQWDGKERSRRKCFCGLCRGAQNCQQGKNPSASWQTPELRNSHAQIQSHCHGAETRQDRNRALERSGVGR